MASLSDGIGAFRQRGPKRVGGERCHSRRIGANAESGYQVDSRKLPRSDLGASGDRESDESASSSACLTTDIRGARVARRGLRSNEYED
jgi:hypothetical protein